MGWVPYKQGGPENPKARQRTARLFLKMLWCGQLCHEQKVNFKARTSVRRKPPKPMNLEPKKHVAEPKSETQSKLERADQEVYEPEGHRNTFYW